MKETTFIKQNKQKWARFEKLSKDKNNDPDEVAQLFTEITEDLSYAKTFYPRRSVRVYLNQLAQGVFTSLYKQRKQPIGSFAKFWTQTVPLEMYRARYHLLTSFIFFGLAIFIGAISQHYDPDFVRIILGDSYVEQTEQRIAEGDPMGVYGTMSSSSMFFMITINNIMVAFLTFALGIFFTLGTYFMLLRNGIMLGAFQWWFKGKGLLLTSFLAVWIHGAFEISAIVIAGAAGLTMGNGFLFPKSFSRMQSLIFSAKRGLVIMVSLIPFFIIAGFLESYVTRHYKALPEIVKWLMILGSFAIIILYYVIYPFIVARKHPDKIELKEVPRYIPNYKIEWFQIRKVNETFTDTFYLLVNRFRKISSLFFTFVFPLLLALIGTIYAFEYNRFDFHLDWHQNLTTLLGFDEDASVLKMIGWPIIMAMIFCIVFYVINDSDDDEKLHMGYLKFVLRHGIWMTMFSALTYGLILLLPGAMLFFGIAATPILFLIPAIIIFEKTNFFTAFARSFKLGKGTYGDSLGTFMVIMIITVIFFFVLTNPIDFMSIIGIVEEIVKEFTITTVDRYAMVMQLVNSVIYCLFIAFLIAIFGFAFALNYYSDKEKKTAQGLYDRLEKFGKRSKNFESEIDYE